MPKRKTSTSSGPVVAASKRPWKFTCPQVRWSEASAVVEVVEGTLRGQPYKGRPDAFYDKSSTYLKSDMLAQGCNHFLALDVFARTGGFDRSFRTSRVSGGQKKNGRYIAFRKNRTVPLQHPVKLSLRKLRALNKRSHHPSVQKLNALSGIPFFGKNMCH